MPYLFQERHIFSSFSRTSYFLRRWNISDGNFGIKSPQAKNANEKVTRKPTGF